MIKLQGNNAKLAKLEKATGRKVFTMSLLSGWSCPFAQECLSKVYSNRGKRTIQDGPETKFRCFSASQEALFPAVYKDRKRNFHTLRKLSQPEITRQLARPVRKIPSGSILRIHVGGDFFSPAYFMAWANVASLFPDNIFYAYTKSLSYWVKYRRTIEKIDNFILTASYGGRQDHLIEREGLRFAKVVFSEAEAESLGLEIDSDDTHAACPEKQFESFALLIHGVQPKGSEAGKAVRQLKGKGSYAKAK